MGLARCAAILSTALAFALYARVELPWALLGWVALVPWIAVLDRERSAAATLANAIAMSVAFVLAVFAWFGVSIARYTGSSPLLTFPLLALAAPALQPQILAFALTRFAMRHRVGIETLRDRAAFAIAASAAWVGTEWLFPHLFGDTVGQGLYPFPSLRQSADVAGTAGLTLVVLLVNESLACALIDARRFPRRALLLAASAAALIAAPTLYGGLRLAHLEAASSERTPLTAALVQANLGDYEGLRARAGTFDAVKVILDSHRSLSNAALPDRSSQRSIELVVWPETVYPTTFGHPKSPAGVGFDAEIVRFVEEIGVPLLFGTYDRAGDRELNAAVLLQRDSDGAIASSTYHKRNLFPLTERVPSWLDSAFARERLPWLGTWQAGDGPSVLDLTRAGGGVVRIAPLICLDAVDPRLAIQAARNGADLIVTLSNDAWFAASRGARLHLVVSAFRSIETRMAQLRATNTGITAAITATGEIVAQIEVGRPTVIAASVDLARAGPTLIVRWGNWLGPVACLLALVLLAGAFTRGTARRDT